MSVIIPLPQHPNASNSTLEVVWQNEKTFDAVLSTGVGFIAYVGRTGGVFDDLFETQAAAQAALLKHRTAAQRDAGAQI